MLLQIIPAAPCCLDHKPAASLPRRLSSRACDNSLAQAVLCLPNVLFNPHGVSRFRKFHMKFRISNFFGKKLERAWLSGAHVPAKQRLQLGRALLHPPLPQPVLPLPFPPAWPCEHPLGSSPPFQAFPPMVILIGKHRECFHFSIALWPWANKSPTLSSLFVPVGWAEKGLGCAVSKISNSNVPAVHSGKSPGWKRKTPRQLFPPALNTC